MYHLQENIKSISKINVLQNIFSRELHYIMSVMMAQEQVEMFFLWEVVPSMLLAYWIQDISGIWKTRRHMILLNVLFIMLPLEMRILVAL